jgi:hypothetical protein
MGHSNLDDYLKTLARYASVNRPSNPRVVGIGNLLTTVAGLSASVASVLSVICGFLFIGITFLLDSRNAFRDSAADILPFLLVLSLVAFGAHSYDLVLLIPVCIWAIGKRRNERGFLPVVILCSILIIPLSAVQIAYEELLSHVVSLPVFRLVLEPFRSWMLLVLYLVMLYLTYSRVLQDRQGETRTAKQRPA